MSNLVSQWVHLQYGRQHSGSWTTRKPTWTRYLVCIKQWLSSQEEEYCRMTFERLLRLINLLLPPSWMSITTSWRSPTGHHCCMSLLQHDDGPVQVGVGVEGGSSTVLYHYINWYSIHILTCFNTYEFSLYGYSVLQQWISWKKSFSYLEKCLQV